MADKKLYVVKNYFGNYWCGHNTWSSQLRHAKVYTSIKYAEEAVERFTGLLPFIVEVKMVEVGADNA